MKYPLIIFLYITLFKKNKLQDCEYFLGKLDLTDYFEEFCNIQIPNIESDCTMLAKNRTFQNITCTINNTVQSKACCFERFRINKVITTRCSYIDKTEDGIREEKRMLRDFLISKGSEELAAKFQLLVNGSTHVKITFEDLKGCPFNPAIQFPINY